MVSRAAVVSDAYDSELPRMAAMLAAVWQITLLIQVVAYLPDYRQPAVVTGVWLGMLAAAAWLVPQARAGGLTSWQAAAAVAVAVVAVAVVGWERQAHGSVDWSVVGTGWLLALVALSRPTRAWITGALLVFTAHAVFAVRLLGTTSLSLARLAATAYTLVVILVIFGALRPALLAYARLAARRAALLSRSAAEGAAAAAVRADRRARLALLEAEALPLLRGIAEERLDIADATVRERCARHAAALRRALSDRPAAGGLLARLEPALAAARSRGVAAEVQVIGDPDPVPPAVAAATVAAVDRLLGVLAPQPVLLTMLASGDDVELYMAFDRPPAGLPEGADVADLARAVPEAARWSAAVDAGQDGASCLEIRWRKQAAA
ncbi:MAG TPA: hypothetical protein VGG35_19085 [Streptosporangiaceae bacterium]